jgi:hypothetical protein
MDPHIGWSLVFILSCFLCAYLGYAAGEAAGRAKGCKVTPQMIEKATMVLLGKEHDPTPHINWICARNWKVNDVRGLMRHALVEAFKTVT